MRGDFIYAPTRMAESRNDEYDASDLLTRPPQGAPPPLSLHSCNQLSQRECTASVHVEGNRIWLPDLDISRLLPERARSCTRTGTTEVMAAFALPMVPATPRTRRDLRSTAFPVRPYRPETP